MGKKLIVFMVAVCCFFSFTADTYACTLWAAAGDKVFGGGSLIVKNRDVKPDYMQELRVVTPDSGYHYFGLYAVDGTREGLTAGMNEKGLVVINATAGSIPQEERLAKPYTKKLMANLLADCKDVDEVVRRSFAFKGPQFLMAADKTKIVIVEIGPNNEIIVRESSDGVIYHTNHYLDDNLLWANQSIDISSQTRYDRIGELLNGQETPFTLEDFISFSQDTNDGEDNSIWSTGSTESSVRTLATWAVRIPPAGSPQLYIKLANPGEMEKVYRVTADEVFNNREFTAR